MALGVDACSRKYGTLIHRESGMKIGIRATLTVRENEQICECLFSNPNGIACNMFTGQAAFTSLENDDCMERKNSIIERFRIPRVLPKRLI